MWKGKPIQKEQAYFGVYCLLMAGMVYSPFLLSLSMFALAILSITRFDITQRGLPVSFDPQALENLKQPFKHPAILVITLYFFIVLLDFWHVQDLDFWLSRLRIKAPLLGLPLVFIAIPRIGQKQVIALHYVLLCLMVLSAAGTGIHYLIHFEEINALLKQGQPIPVPRNHIQFSLLMAYAVISGSFLYTGKDFIKRRIWRNTVLGMTVFLFLCIHLLAVRTGLLALYLSLLVLVGRYIWLSGKYWIAVVVCVSLILIPVAGYLTIPSFKTRIDYTRYDFLMHRQGTGKGYSDSDRIVSLLVGCEIVNAHPVFGVGSGNLRRAVKERFHEKYPRFDRPYMPHNQFLYVLAGSGLTGFVLFLFAFWFPLVYRQHFQHPMVLGLYSIFMVSFMTGHALENAAGVAFFSFFLLFWLNHLREENR